MNEQRATELVGQQVDIRPARVAASAFFLLDGAGFGVWAALLPSLKARLGLDEMELSYVLFSMVIGALISMPIAGRQIVRHGSHRTLVWIAPVFSLALLGPMFTPNLYMTMGAAMLFGAMKGALDVSVNAQAITVETAAARPIMATFQALWSIGGLIAAFVTGLALRFGATPPWIALCTSGVIIALILSQGGKLMPESPVTHVEGASPTGGLNIRLLSIGALTFVALFTEGVMMDWSSVYSRYVAGAAPWLAPFAYGVFSCAMATGRLLGDWLTARWGAMRVLVSGGILAASGTMVIALVPYWPVTFVGLCIAGLGIANLVPILFGAGGRAHPGGVGRGIALVSTIGYTGFLSGPPLVGSIAHASNLPVAFALVAVISSLLAICGKRVIRQ